MLAELPTLQRGHKNERVTALQELLNRLGYGGLVVDGMFGPATESAVKAFQARHGLTTDGVVGPLTLDRLQQASTQVVSPSVRETAALTSGASSIFDKLKVIGFSGFPIWTEVVVAGALIYAATVTSVIARSK